MSKHSCFALGFLTCGLMLLAIMYSHNLIDPTSELPEDKYYYFLSRADFFAQEAAVAMNNRDYSGCNSYRESEKVARRLAESNKELFNNHLAIRLSRAFWITGDEDMFKYVYESQRL